MTQQQSEFFKLDEIDRKVFFWLIYVKAKSIRSWIFYIETEYKRKQISIDSNLLFNEAIELLQNETAQLDLEVIC